MAERYLYARVTDLLFHTAHPITALRQRPVPSHQAIKIATTAKELILQDLSINYTIAALARHCGTNSPTLKKVFREQFTISLSQFFRQVRIDRAKELLQATNLTLQVIAEMVGYPEGNNFQVTFKKVVRCTWGEWRRGLIKWKRRITRSI